MVFKLEKIIQGKLQPFKSGLKIFYKSLPARNARVKTDTQALHFRLDGRYTDKLGGPSLLCQR